MSFSVCVSGYRHFEAPSSTPLVDGPFCTYTARHCHHTFFTGTTQPGGTFFRVFFRAFFLLPLGSKLPTRNFPAAKQTSKQHISSPPKSTAPVCWPYDTLIPAGHLPPLGVCPPSQKKPPPTQLHVSPVRLPSLDLTLQTPLLDFPAPSAA